MPRQPGQGRGEAKDSPRRVASRVRRAQAVEMRVSGMRWSDIGARLGVSEARARQYVDEACRTLPAENVEQLRAIQGDQLNVLMETLWPRATDANHKDNTWCIDRVLKVMERQAALYGMDMPAKTDLTSAGQPVAFTIMIPSAKDHERTD